MRDLAETRPTTAVPRIEEIEPADDEDLDVQLESLSQAQLAWRRFRKHRLAMVGAGIFIALLVVAAVGPILVPYDYYLIPAPDQIVEIGRPPSAQHLFGETGALQRDVFVLTINGIRMSMVIALLATFLSTVLGTLVGGVAGYFKGAPDAILMRIVDALLALPLLFVILVASRFFGSGSWLGVALIFALFGWLGLSRLVRSLILSLREADFVDAARAAGVSSRRIIFRHLLPNSVSPIIVAATLSIAAVIIGEAFVSFLGFGVDVTTPTLGNILSGSLSYVTRGNWWWAFFPGGAIVLIVLSISFMGDGLQDALDPRARV